MAKFKHGLSKHPLHRVWTDMKSRCFNSNHYSFSAYGERGIEVCNDWRFNFLNFFNWATDNGWIKGLHIDRINNDGNYEPNNCRFISPRMNSSNTRKQQRNLPIGVKKLHNKFAAQILIGGFDTPERANEMYNKLLKFVVNNHD